MRPVIAISAFVTFALVSAAQAQVVVEPGTEFPAAPMSKGGLSFSAPAQPIAAAPPLAPVVAPPPAPAPTKRRKRRRG